MIINVGGVLIVTSRFAKFISAGNSLDRDAQIAYERTKQIMAAEFGISVDDPAE
jgi:hypothetical protein